MKYPRAYLLIFTVLLSFTTSYITYFGFSITHGHNVFSKKSFESKYDRSVFKYRILSRFLLLELNDLLDNKFPIGKPSRQVQYLDPEGTNHFYQAFFILNTVFLCLTSIMSVLLINLKDVFKITRT